ncbi:MAG: hypothetical protein J6R37_01680 [Clostridia bacterium]|nr:hypothetical protein [Clostridia bacterium]
MNDQTPLYSSPDKSKVICWLEKSYYLKVLEQTGSLYLVELMDNSFGYPKILGYVDTLEVEICSSPPLAPTYPKTYVTVSSGGATIYVAPSLNSQAIYTATNNQKLNYFGTIEVDGQRWYFVWYCQQLGYVRSIFTTEPNVELHPTPLHPEPEPETNNPPPNHEGGKEENPLPQNNLTSWLMIGFVVLLATTLCMALFLPSKSKQQPIYFGED